MLRRPIEFTLDATVAVMDQTFGGGARPKGLFQCIQGDVGLQRVCDPPADDLPREDVDYERDVNESSPGRNVSQIRDPQLIRTSRTEVAIDPIGRPQSRFIRYRRLELSTPNDSLNSHSPHQSRHRATGHADPFPVQLLPDFTGAVDLPILTPDTVDLDSKLRVSLRSIR